MGFIGDFESFLEQFQKENENEKKIKLAISYMRSALTLDSNPDFKGFWESRRLCLLMFKEHLNASVRSVLWSEYIDLSEEGRRLRLRFEEDNSFVAEQIDLAINALVTELEDYNARLACIPEIKLPENLSFLFKKVDFYESIQKELTLLSVFTGRVNSLRKEILKTSMRQRLRSEFLKRLSAIGNKVFPKRKELIDSLSEEFAGVVKVFVSRSIRNTPFYVLRGEIKSLQQLAKQLTLNTHTFSSTRLALSDYWDKIRLLEKESKKEINEKKELLQGNYRQALQKIEEFEKDCLQESSVEKVSLRAKEILEYLQSVELVKEDIYKLKQKIEAAQLPVFNKIKEQKDRQEQELIERKKQELERFHEKIEKLLTEQSLEILEREYQTVRIQMKKMDLNGAQKYSLQKSIKLLSDILHQKKETRIFSESSDNIKKLREILLGREKHCQNIKAQLEKYRKALGGSGFDFEKAMMYKDMICEEKERLEKANDSIFEIKQQISTLEE